MEHSKYLFNLKYFCSTFMELCLKQINRHTQFRDMQSVPGKQVGGKKTNKQYLPNSIPFFFSLFSQSHLKLFSEHVQPPYCTGLQVVQPSCSMPLFVWLTSSQDIGNKEPPHDGGWNAASATKSLQSCPTLCDPVDGSPPGSSVPGILQARVLEWGAIAFSGGWTEVDQNNKDKILLH